MSEPSSDDVEAGHAFYTRRALAIYDLAILGYFSRLAWKCPSRVILDHYNEHITSNHLDVGVGTGYFLDRCDYPTAPPRVGLLDLNQNCLDAASERVSRYSPEVHRANVLAPLTVATAKFDSIGMNYLLHCLPGTIRTKAVVFEHLAALANPGALIFGATLLHGGVRRNWFARRVMDRNNAHGIFCNAEDDLDGLQWAVGQHLTEAVVETVGCVGFFSGRIAPHPDPATSTS